MNSHAVAIGYVILMASITGRRNLAQNIVVDFLFLKSCSVNTFLFKFSLLALIVT